MKYRETPAEGRAKPVAEADLPPPATGLNELVDQVLQKFLAAANIGIHFAFLEHVSFQFFESHFARFNFRTDAGIPGRITIFHKLAQTSVGADGCRNLQAARKRVHTANMRMKQVNRLKA